MSRFEWAITEDWETPARGESWHEATHYDSACRAAVEMLKRRIGSIRSIRFVQTARGTVLDVGSHTLFGIVKVGKG